jgi:quinol monooxygenase YgiN
MTNRERYTRRAFLKLAGGTAAAAALIGRGSRSAAVAPDEQITAVTLIHGIPGREEELKQHLLSLAGPTHAEPGCITYDLYESPNDPHEFMRFEIWTSLDALESHKKMPHLRASFEKRQREGWTTQILTWIRVPESDRTGRS